MSTKGASPRRAPLEDVRAVVIAARGVVLSSPLLAHLAKRDAVVLHCDEAYRPVAITAGTSRTIDPLAARQQVQRGLKIHERLWTRVLKAKAANQVRVLEFIGASVERIAPIVKRKGFSESHVARLYWREYFSTLGEPETKRRTTSDSPLNARLNYGYAMLGALVHRSIVAHGLHPQFGIHHAMSYKSFPLVYDLIEPMRPWIDLTLFDYCREDSPESEMKLWAKTVGRRFHNDRIVFKKTKLKWIDGVDYFVRGIARCYAERSVKPFWSPLL